MRLIDKYYKIAAEYSAAIEAERSAIRDDRIGPIEARAREEISRRWEKIVKNDELADYRQAIERWGEDRVRQQIVTHRWRPESFFDVWGKEEDAAAKKAALEAAIEAASGGLDRETLVEMLSRVSCEKPGRCDVDRVVNGKIFATVCDDFTWEFDAESNRWKQSNGPAVIDTGAGYGMNTNED